MRRAVQEVVKGLERSKKSEKDRVMVFCEEGERRERLVDELGKRGVEAAHLWAGDGRDWAERKSLWEGFTRRDGHGVRVAVCAKSFGRGLDHVGIGMVLLVDVPMTGVEYLHRVGRLRGEGRVVVLVGRKELAIAQQLFLRVLNEQSVASVRPKGAWKEFCQAGRNRVGASKLRRGTVRWIDD